MSLIEKIDAEMAEVETDRIDIKDGRERDVWNNGYDKGMKKGLQIAKRIILSEQKEPIGNSEQLTEQKEPCKFCKDVENIKYQEMSEKLFNGTTRKIIGDTECNCCPMCGRRLNQSATNNNVVTKSGKDNNALTFGDMPPLTSEEQKKVLEYAWCISDCINEPDKVFIYNDSINQIYKKASRRGKHN